jgi:hypothetical protein
VRKRADLPRGIGMLRRGKIPAAIEGGRNKKTPNIFPVYGKIPAYKKIIKFFARIC